MPMNANVKELLDAYYAAEDAASRAADDDDAADAADAVSVAAWDAYQAALKAAEKGGKR